MRIRNAVVASVAVIALVALGLFGTADAGLESNTVTVEKVVEGPVPEGTVFEIEVDCDLTPRPVPPAEATPSIPVPDPVTLEFDANGDPLGTDMVSAPLYGTCIVTEIVDGGASTVSYKCVETPLPNGNAEPQPMIEPVECIDDQTVGFGQLMAADETADYEIIGAEATVTVTNTFEPEPEPEPETEPAAAARTGVVAARPAFTG
jgi:hypothetical protein